MTPNRTAQIIRKAQEIGAAMAGIASVELLKTSPSHELQRHTSRDFGGTPWPRNARSALVIALSHPRDQPELDWWDAVGGSPGNRLLVRINRELGAWIEDTFGLKTRQLPYSVGEGGVYLKDAAVLAGLGCIGRNNLLVTPQLGPRVRLRAMLIQAELPPTGPIAFDPCAGCEEYCRKACPRNALENAVHSSVQTRMADLPGRDGRYSRARCMQQMDEDVENSGIDTTEMEAPPVDTEIVSTAEIRVKYCRECELACPIGS